MLKDENPVSIRKNWVQQNLLHWLVWRYVIFYFLECLHKHSIRPNVPRNFSQVVSTGASHPSS